MNADLPTPAGFAGASQFVRPEDVAEKIICGPDLDEIVEGVKPYWEAGFTDIALVQVGDEGQQRFLDEAAGRCWRRSGRPPAAAGRGARPAAPSWRSSGALLLVADAFLLGDDLGLDPALLEQPGGGAASSSPI